MQEKIKDLEYQLQAYEKTCTKINKCMAKDCPKYIYPNNQNICIDCELSYCDDHLSYIEISYDGYKYCSRGYGCYQI